MRNSVVLPAPFGPTTPTMPAGGGEKVRSSTRSRSPKPLRTPSASITTSPSRGPGARRDVDLDAVQLAFLPLGEQALVRAEPRLRLRVARARAGAHPLEL